MAQGNDVLKRINERYPHLSKGQKLLANYITEHYEKAVYLTASKLGQIVGVSESTVVRFANELGYDGYPSLQRALEELVKVRLTALQRMEVSKGRMDQSHILTSILQADMDNIKATLEMADEEGFKKAVDAILRSRRIYILGVRSCASLAAFLGFYMNLLFDDVRLIHTNSVSETFEQMLKIGAEDVVIGISFPRYSKRTVRAMEFAKSRGAKVVAVTDSDVSPLIPFSDYTLKARSDMVSFVDSLVAPLSLLNSLIVALSIGRRDEITHSLSSLESIWKEYDVYDSEERDDLVFGKPLP
ncbi:MurR/RpiR family transcriptional regulator [Bianquea renquensis]|jgi:transcriptional regulator, RpiR family|uniref:MurR/RpiR family transcriptional regulator n=1 Tax=Bianquea renquensis TaxID=2763661 RepID=A0A926DSI7_9FIRM|nr:MurR/RpiR family transcriptional regulator [Bianquea renquensis]MBC8543012.1 MurR/RpiR family transcriptional regulator [Bianquea renquensis]